MVTGSGNPAPGRNDGGAGFHERLEDVERLWNGILVYLITNLPSRLEWPPEGVHSCAPLGVAHPGEEAAATTSEFRESGPWDKLEQTRRGGFGLMHLIQLPDRAERLSLQGWRDEEASSRF